MGKTIYRTDESRKACILSLHPHFGHIVHEGQRSGRCKMTSYQLLTNAQDLSKKPVEVNDLGGGYVRVRITETKQTSNKKIFGVALVKMIMLRIISPCDFTIRS